MVRFCAAGDGYSEAWVDGGLSRCFLDVVGSITCAGIVFILGFGGIVLAPKPKVKSYARKNVPLSQTVLSGSFLLESIMCLLFSLTYTCDLIVKGALHIHGTGENIYGQIIVLDTLGITSWLFVCFLIHKERLKVLAKKPHGVTVVLFWLLNALWLCLEVMSWGNMYWWWRLETRVDIAELIIFVARVIFIVILIAVGVIRPLWHQRKRPYTLLVNQAKESDVEEQEMEERVKEKREKREKKEGNFVRTRTASPFSSFWHRVKLLFPYVWPKNNRRLQAHVVACFILLLCIRLSNVFVPIYYKKIVDALTPSTNSDQEDESRHVPFPLVSILIYAGLRFLGAGSVGNIGFLNNFRSFLWIPVQQYTDRTLQVDLLSHLHSLSLRWHLGRKTGEVLRVVDRGKQSVTNLLSYALFSITPTFIDIGVAVIYFIIAFDGWFGLIVFTTMVSYILFTIHVTEWRTKFRRVMNEKDNMTQTRAVDSLLNFETVKCYGAEDYEVKQFRKAVLNYQKEEWKSLASLTFLNSGQNLIISLGLLFGAILCAYRVSQGQLTVGDFVLYCTYIIQLYTPLNYFGTHYRTIQQALVDMENMFDLLAVEREVCDAPGAAPLQLTGGQIEFKNVNFHYIPEKLILRDISFTVEPGKTLALVGPSGGGKSTIIRLLFRFYDIQDGVIMIDGQDLTSVTQKSVRDSIGVVPQDTVLFNEKIRYNIRYGKTDASDEEVETAATYADIHDRVLSFHNQYDTVVGERGLKLSGGEKQRVAIARTILKAPAIILLDEATSALDTETERNIQSSLMRVCQGRTTIIVAHRLSTIIHADQILVLNEGTITERGTHAELLEREGTYASMWNQQQQSLDKGEEVVVQMEEKEEEVCGITEKRTCSCCS